MINSTITKTIQNFSFGTREKTEVDSSVVRVSLPFKDQTSANAVKRQMRFRHFGRNRQMMAGFKSNYVSPSSYLLIYSHLLDSVVFPFRYAYTVVRCSETSTERASLQWGLGGMHTSPELCYF